MGTTLPAILSAFERIQAVPLILITAHFLLLLRQSQLLLRPHHDPFIPGTDAQNYRKKNRKESRPTFLYRVQLHGSGAALSMLPLLGLLFYKPTGRPPDYFSLLSHPIWPPLLIVQALISLPALVATGFKNFNSLVISSRNAGPADFGRRSPLWPDGILYLGELTYLALLCYTLQILNPILSILWLPLLHTYYRNYQHHTSPATPAQIQSFTRLNHPQESPLYLLR
ncbi:MAG: hypothetical protein AAF975_08570, partial [Spirochaetota bacterium]